MPVRIAQYVRDYNDVVDEEFLRDFAGVEAIKATGPEDLGAALDGAEILHIFNSAFTPEVARIVAAHGGLLKWIQFTTVGIDIAEESGLPDDVWITNIGDISQKILAGHAIALMLGVMRGFQQFQPHRENHAWSREEMFPHMVAPEGGTMVIFGMGRMGQDIARKAKAFDMEVVCVTRADAPAVPEIDRVMPRAKAGEALAEADVVMVAMALDDETVGFLDAEKLSRMKESAVLVNVSRGQVVDEAALAAILAAGRIRGAGLDAFAVEPLPTDSPLWGLDNVLMTPHVAGQGGSGQWRRLSELVRENTRRYLEGQPLENVVRKPAGEIQK